MNGCPRQSCRKAMDAYNETGTMVFKILPPSPDLIPIENLFCVVVRDLHNQAITNSITNDTKEFVARAEQLTLSFLHEKYG